MRRVRGNVATNPNQWEVKLSTGIPGDEPFILKITELQAPSKPEQPWIGLRRGWQQMRLQDALVRLTPRELKTHLYTCGATGSGKTTFIESLIAQDIKLGHSFVVLDMRGNLAQSALELCAGNIEPSLVTLFDLREKARPFGFNPLAGEGEAYFRALNVLDVIASESESWGVQLAETLRNALMLLAHNQGNLTQLDRLFYDPVFRANLVSNSPSEAVQVFWNKFEELSEDRKNGMAAPVLNKVSLMTGPEALRRTLGHPEPVNLGRHLNTKGSVTLVSLAVDELHSAARMTGNMILKTITREVFSRISIPEAQRNPVRLYVDEFENFDYDQFESILAEGRKFGLTLVLAHQTLAQLTPRIRSLLLNNVGAKVVFRTGREDAAILNKDLTGDPKALDLFGLPVGSAMLWKRGHPVIQVEMNEPLIKNLGTLSENGKEYLNTVKGLAPEWTENKTATHVSDSSKPAKPSNGKRQGTATLEDWL